MQDELARHNPSLNSMILAVNEEGQESGNDLVHETLPLLQDVDANSDSASDVWTLWNVAWRDVFVLDRDNNEVFKMNLTQNSLAIDANYQTLKREFIEAGQLTPTSKFQSPIEPLDVNKDTFISPIDALLVINELGKYPNSRPPDPPAGTTPTAYIDPSGDGFVTPIDALLIINHLDKYSSTAFNAPMSSSTTSDEMPGIGEPQLSPMASVAERDEGRRQGQTVLLPTNDETNLVALAPVAPLGQTSLAGDDSLARDRFTSDLPQRRNDRILDTVFAGW